MTPPIQHTHEEKIIASWQKNAKQWTTAVRAGQIESRKSVTDKAIIEAVLNQAPESVIDIGCGEGWLLRELASQVNRTLGVDAIPALIEQAKVSGGGDFLALSYEAIAGGAIKASFDVAVCNFSLLGKESVEVLFSGIPSLLNPGGIFIVQTLHPLVACGDLPYADAWREGSWAGFNADFIDPAPWYFRTVESWQALFSDKGFHLLEIREPLHPLSRKPASILFIAACAAEKT